MSATNFRFLKDTQNDLAILGQQAETYSHVDPESSAIKLRCLAEKILTAIFKAAGIRCDRNDSFLELLKNEDFLRIAEDSVVDKFHHIRLKGNKAAHGKGLSIVDALALVEDGFFLAAWYFVSYGGGRIEDLPKYVEPKPPIDSLTPLLEDNERLKENLILQTEELEKALSELNASQKEVQYALNEIPVGEPISYGERLDQLALAGSQTAAKLNLNPLATLRRIVLQDIFAEYNLTEGQKELIDQLADFLSDRAKKVFLVKGYAGTGKTFITKGLTEYFQFIKRSYILAAPTGKAAKVISSKTLSHAHTIHKTIYSFKDLLEYRDEGLDGTETYKLYAKLAVNEDSSDTVYIVDEASMISDIYQESEFFRFGSGYMLRDLLKYVNLDHNDHFKKLILIGDDAQLPPIGMTFSPALDRSYLAKEHNLLPDEFELTEVVRQKAGSGVMENSIKLRTSLKSNIFNELDFNMDYDDLTHIEPVDLMPSYLEACQGKINAEAIVIAYSNSDVFDFNKRIRQHFFPGIEEVTPGDKLMVVSNNSSHGFLISNGDFVLVRQVCGERETIVVPLRRGLETIEVPLHFRSVEIGVRNLDGDPVFLKVKLLENLLYSENANLSSDENKALYVYFAIRAKDLKLKPNTTEFKQTLMADPYFNALKVKFGYAITCHKAQGSEWNHVFVKCRTHMSQLSKDYFRWLYTAITRTAKQLYLLDEPHIRIGRGIKRTVNPGASIEYFKPIPLIEPAHISESIPVHSFTGNQTSLTEPKQQHEIEPPSTELPPGLSNQNSNTDPNFGSSTPLLLAILDEVRQAISGRGIALVDLQHKQYMESYIFQRGSDSARINLTYNGDSRVTAIVAPIDSELSSNIKFLLEPIIGKLLVADSEDSFEFPEEFLRDFHTRLDESCRRFDVHVAGVKSKNYMQRYTFEKAGESVVVDINYNRKKQITRCHEQRHLCSSMALLDEVLTIITTEL